MPVQSVGLHEFYLRLYFLHFLTKGFILVMDLLVVYISSHPLQTVYANRECCKAVLPGYVSLGILLKMFPRIPLNRFHHIGNTLISAQPYQQMNMVFYAVNAIQVNFMFACNIVDNAINLPARWSVQNRLTIFCGPDKMDSDRGIALRHNGCVIT